MAGEPKRYRAEAWDVLQHHFRTSAINDRTIHFAARMSAAFDETRLRRSVDLLAGAFPLLRCAFVEDDGHPYWEDRGHTSTDMVETLETDDVARALRRLLLKEADAANGPQAKIGVIRNGNAEFFCMSINHMLADAAGSKELLYHLSSIYANLGSDPSYHPTPLLGRRDVGQVVRTFSPIEKAHILVARNDMTKHDPTQIDLEGDPNRPLIERIAVERDEFGVLRDYAREHDVTINDVLMTAYIRMLSHHFGRAVTLPCTVDLRKYLPNRRAGSICNLVTTLSCDIGEDVGGTFDSTLGKVSKEMRRLKGDIGCMKSMWLMDVGYRVLSPESFEHQLASRFTNPPIAFTNLGVLDKERLGFGEIGMDRAFMTGSIKYAPYFQIAAATFDNIMTLSANLYGTEKDGARMSALLGEMVAELHQVTSG